MEAPTAIRKPEVAFVIIEDVLQRAELLADLGRFDEADPLVAQALAEQPDSEDGLALRMRGQVGRRHFAEAAKTTEQLLRAHPDSIRGLLAMARIQWLLDRPGDGVPFARRAVELYPHVTNCLVTLADVLKRVQAGSAEALALIDQAIAIDPEYADAYLVAGQLHLDVIRYAEAERWFLRALAITPDDPGAVLKLGLARAGLGRFDESRDAVMTTLRMDAQPANLKAVIEHVEYRGIPDHLAEIYRMALTALGRPDLSIPGAAGNDPELIAAQGKLIHRMWSLHSTPEGERKASELVETLLAVDPKNQDARYVLSRIHDSNGQHGKALKLAKRLAKEGYPDANHALMVAQIGKEDYKGALDTLDRALRGEPDRPPYLVLKAVCLRHLDRNDEALKIAGHAVELSPYGIETHLQLGLAAWAAGEPALTEQALSTAVAQSEADYKPAAYLALFYAQNDRWPEAQPLMETLRLATSGDSSMVKPCVELATACIGRAVQPLSNVDDEAADDEVRRLIDEAAPWLDRCLDMYAVAAEFMRRDDVADLPNKLGDLIAALRRMPASEDTDYARVLRRFEAMMRTWRSV